MEIADALNEMLAGQNAVWLVLTALVLALLMFRLNHVLVYAVIGVGIHYFGYLVMDIVNGADMSAIGVSAGQTFSEMFASPVGLLVLYLVYLALIGILYLIKSIIFRRG